MTAWTTWTTPSPPLPPPPNLPPRPFLPSSQGITFDEDDNSGTTMADDSLDEETQERAMAGVKWDVRAEVDKVCVGGGEGGPRSRRKVRVL